MARKLKKTYRFALRSSVFITLITSTLGFLVLLLQSKPPDSVFILFPLICFITCFIVIQHRVERFIYHRINKLYKDVALLESRSYSDPPITTDIATLTEEVKRFASDKKLEIETLKVRENYRKEFMGNVSHELRTPLFLVQGYILTLLDGALNDKAVRKKYLQRAYKGVERLVYIVEDLDMIAKLEMGDLRLEYEDFDIVEVIRNTFEFMEIKASKKNINLSFDVPYKEPIWAHGDRERISQVLSNLIMNSIKYGLENGTTEVSIENLTNDKLLVRVTDNGEGISKEHIPRIFERFYRVDKSGSRKEGGSGLGLSIVKHIIEAHGEKIYVESVLGLGSEFSFTLKKAKKPDKV